MPWSRSRQPSRAHTFMTSLNCWDIRVCPCIGIGFARRLGMGGSRQLPKEQDCPRAASQSSWPKSGGGRFKSNGVAARTSQWGRVDAFLGTQQQVHASAPGTLD